MRAFLEIGGAVFTLLGVVIGVYATFLMTKFYHPFGLRDFLKSIGRVLFGTATFQEKKDTLYINFATALAKLTPEDKAASLRGIYWLFLGFILQTIGATLITIDAFLINVG